MQGGGWGGCRAYNAQDLQTVNLFCHSCLLCYLFIWFWGVLDRAQGLTLVLQFVVELPEFSSSIAGLLVDSFTAFITDLLPCI